MAYICVSFGWRYAHFISQSYLFVGFAVKSSHYCKVKSLWSFSHEFCKCKGKRGGNTGESCKVGCRYDIQCKGYDWGIMYDFCRYYTSADCPVECQEETKSSLGRVGKLDFEHTTLELTCAIKIYGTAYISLGIQTTKDCFKYLNVF